MKSLRMSSLVIAASTLVVASAACTRAAPKERGEIAAATTEPVSTANLQIATMVVEPAKTEGNVAAAKKASANDACPAGMVLVEGEYCPEVEHKCLEWMDP